MTWFSPDPRAILELDKFHISKSLRKCIRQNTFRVTINRDFAGVIRACGEPSEGRSSTWITADLAAAYVRLYREGHAHSVETWKGDLLVGGLYGVVVGGLFAGESMFSRESNASKVALYHLVQHLKALGYVLLDTQTSTAHLRTMGGIEISRRAYLERLKIAVNLKRTFA